MSKKSPPGTSSSGAPGGSVDFILRTAMERASSNKRPIRPKLVDDSLLGDDSDDSDFEIDEQHNSDSNSDTGSGSGSGSDGGSDQSNSDGSSDGSGSNDSSSDDEASKQSSSLRETLRKLNEETANFEATPKKKPKKKSAGKAKKKAQREKTVPTKGKASPNPKSKQPVKVVAKKGGSKTKVMVNKKNKVPEKKKSDNYVGSITDRVHQATGSMGDIRKDIDLKRKICSVCLGEKSDVANEIVECDACCVTVHEGCYNMSDSLSVSSGSGSSSSTEPWFCDICKRPEDRGWCILCPNPDGLLKITLEGQFVHVICALYIPKVTFSHEGRPSLSTFPYTRWGRKACSLCSNTRVAHTGSTVNCDAGMCKSNVHITCAQKFGFLSYPSLHGPTDEAADPYYASCKVHGSKEQAKSRARLFQVLQEQIRIKRERKTHENLNVTEQISESRVMDKLQKIRARVGRRPSIESCLETVRRKGKDWTIVQSQCLLNLTETKARSMKTCAFSVLRFLQKVEVMGEDISSLELEQKHQRIVANVKKRWNVHPSLSVEFAAYYSDREARIERMSQQCKTLVKDNNTLNDKQIALASALETEAVNQMEVMDESSGLDNKINELKGILKALVPENMNINNIRGLSPRLKSPRRSGPSHSKPTKSNKSGVNGKSFGMSPLFGRLALNTCALCSKSDQPHLITKCDHCQKHYHLGCLDPPLTRMPKRSRLCGWMCSDCCEEEESQASDSNVVDTEAPRALRGRTSIKRPPKYRDVSEDSADYEFPIRVKEKTASPSDPVVIRAQHQQPSTSTNPYNLLRGLHVKVEHVATQNGTVVHSSTSKALSVKQGPTPANTEKVDPGPNLTQIRRGQKRLLSKSEAAESKAVEPKSQPAPKTPPVKRSRRISGQSPPIPTVPVPAPSNGTGHPCAKAMLSTPGHKKETAPKKPSPIQIEGLSKNGTDGWAPTSASGWSSGCGAGFGPLEKKAPLPVVKTSHPARKQNPSTSDKNPKTPNSPEKSIPNSSEKNTPNSSEKNTPNSSEKNTPNSSEKTKRVRVRKAPRKSRTPDKDMNISTQITAAINFNYSPGSSTPTGKCSACNKPENKKNMVMCDECSKEFHFICVSPFVPYNPKRRGYSWFCSNCNDEDDDDVSPPSGSVKPKENGARVSH